MRLIDVGVGAAGRCVESRDGGGGSLEEGALDDGGRGCRGAVIGLGGGGANEANFVELFLDIVHVIGELVVASEVVHCRCGSDAEVIRLACLLTLFLSVGAFSGLEGAATGASGSGHGGCGRDQVPVLIYEKLNGFRLLVVQLCQHGILISGGDEFFL